MIKDIHSLDNFIFSQNSLNTFSDCPLKFKKRYIDNLKWNTLPSASIQEIIEMGRDFHLIAQRYFSEIISDSENINGKLGIWFKNLVENFPLDKNILYLPEYKLRTSFNNIKLEANYDLIMINSQNQVKIWDWKTHYRHTKTKGKANENKLLNSYQTIIYMYVLKQQIGMLTGKDIDFQNISMTYWCPYPAQIVCTIPYSQDLHNKNERILKKAIKKILSFNYDNFDKSGITHCNNCEFNLLCNNKKPDFSSIDTAISIINELDLDHIEEIF